MQSQSTFPNGVLINTHRCPMATLGSVQILQKRVSSSIAFQRFLQPLDFSSDNVVKDCPVGGTNWRGSSQMRQRVRRDGSSMSNWVPQAEQIRRRSELESMLFTAGGVSL
jgi:hypothetical protein